MINARSVREQALVVVCLPAFTLCLQYKVKDIAEADFGRLEIELAEAEMPGECPALGSIHVIAQQHVHQITQRSNEVSVRRSGGSAQVHH